MSGITGKHKINRTDLLIDQLFAKKIINCIVGGLKNIDDIRNISILLTMEEITDNYDTNLSASCFRKIEKKYHKDICRTDDVYYQRDIIRYNLIEMFLENTNTYLRWIDDVNASCPVCKEFCLDNSVLTCTHILCNTCLYKCSKCPLCNIAVLKYQPAMLNYKNDFYYSKEYEEINNEENEIIKEKPV